MSGPLNLLYPVECRAAEVSGDSRSRGWRRAAGGRSVAGVRMDGVDGGGGDSGGLRDLRQAPLETESENN